MIKNMPALAASAALIFGGQAAAASFTLDFGAGSQSSNAIYTGASGQVDFDFADEGGDVRITLTIANTTGAEGPATMSKLTGFSFDKVGDFSVLGWTVGDDLDTFLTDIAFTPFSNSVGNFDFGFADNGNFLGGNANDALPQGEDDTMSMLLDTSLDAASMMAAYAAAFADGSAHAALRFMQVNFGEGSDKLLYLPPEGEVVPIPGAALLMGTALLAGGIARRRAKR